MKVALNATEALWDRLTGTGVYVRHLVTHMRGMPELNRLALLAMGDCREDESIVGGNTSLVRIRGFRSRTLWSQVSLPLHFFRNRYDVIHFPDHKLPPWSSGPTVVTIHDLACLLYPETFSTLHRLRLQWFTRDAIRRANRIIAVSQSTKNDICRLFGTNPDRVDVVHHGVDHALFGRNSGRKREYPYILSVGELQPRKNYLMLIRAFKRLCDRTEERLELVIVGKPGWFWEPIRDAAADPSLAGRVILAGYVPDEELRSLYAGALFVAMPSLYEGFGIPLLEAMASGTALIASNASSFPEIVSHAGILLDPVDEDGWAESMWDLYRNDARREELGRLGAERSRLFDWNATAKNTVATYERVR